MAKNTSITPSQVKAIKTVVRQYISDERRGCSECLLDEGIVDEDDEDIDSMTDEEFYEKYHADYDHIWFYLYELSQIE